MVHVCDDDVCDSMMYSDSYGRVMLMVSAADAIHFHIGVDQFKASCISREMVKFSAAASPSYYAQSNDLQLDVPPVASGNWYALSISNIILQQGVWRVSW